MDRPSCDSTKTICVEERVKKRVHFVSEDDVFIIERYADMMTDGEKASLWYTRQDDIRIQRSISKTIRNVQNNTDAKHRCIRGLEHMISPEYSEQRNTNIDFVRISVLREQRKQQMLGIYDQDEMRKKSLSASEWARYIALEQGAADEKIAIKRHHLMEISRAT
uniref:Uncharacterized protein n=1 Tax=Ditylum brightwellii TaxID=49249 RepID=A0A6V2EY48_9STRA